MNMDAPIILTIAFPSPRPSPLGRGRIAPSALANPQLASARTLSNFMNVASSCSLSPGERVRVRGNTTTFYWSAGFRLRGSVLECGGKRRATPPSGARPAKNISGGPVRAKAVSPLRFATALQDLADARFTHHLSLITL